MKKYACLTLVVSLLFCLLPLRPAAAQSACTGSQNVANCPPCYFNNPTPRTHGTGPNGRASVHIFIQGGTGADSWDDPPGSHHTNNEVWGAIDGAASLWNNATDTTSEPGVTHRPPYEFHIEQGDGVSNSDVVIARDPSTTYASTDRSTTPPTIRVNPTWFFSLTPDQRAAVIAHELGHSYGLGNAYTSGTGCERANTIMNGLNGSTLQPVYTQVEQRDVYQMNKNKEHPDAAAPTSRRPTRSTPT